MHTQNNLNNHMQQPTPFERHLNEYISMAIEIWPTMRTSLQHLSEVGSPRSDSFLPQRDYASMNSNDFMATISHDLTVFISSHDVRQQDLQDYLYDILDLLMVDEDLLGGTANPTSVESIAASLQKVINLLQEGQFEVVHKFREQVYEPVRNKTVQVIDRTKEDSQQSESSCSDEEIEKDAQVSERERDKRQLDAQRAQQLEDQGWIIVRK